MLNFLKTLTHPEAQLAVHQCVQFGANPKLPHNQAVKRVLNYLKGTSTPGLIMNPDPEKVIESYVDADLICGCNREESKDPVLVLSITGYVITCANCPIIWVIRIQT